MVAQQGSEPVLVTMHWEMFTLTDEPLDEPPVHARTAWNQVGLPADRLWVMSPGETRFRRI